MHSWFIRRAPACADLDPGTLRLTNLQGIGMDSANASAKLAHGARKALSANHKNVGGAIAAGTAAVLGHGALAGRTFLTDRSISPARRRYRKGE